MLLITFIIPTIGRETLVQSLDSLLNLKEIKWNAIILFDGIKNNISSKSKFNSDQFTFLEIEKQGKEDIKNNAGKVRNIGIEYIFQQHINTDFIAFLDDDDTLHPNYGLYLMQELKLHPNLDTCIFRMMYPNGYFLPNKYHTKIKVKQFGISFVIRKQYLEKNAIQFQNHPYEDFIFLKSLQYQHSKIVISPYIAYFIRTNYLNCQSYLCNIQCIDNDKNKEILPRILINF